MVNRLTYHDRALGRITNRSPLGALIVGDEKMRRFAWYSEANLISSRTSTGKHAPVIDLDVPHRVIPSTTPGHGHLYIDVETSWPRYALLLLALRWCGIIERGHCYWSLRRGGTFVRLPHIRKED